METDQESEEAAQTMTEDFWQKLKKDITKLIIIVAVCLVLCAGSVIAITIFDGMTRSNNGDEAYNLQAIREELADYEHVDAGAAPNKKIALSQEYLIVRLKDDAWDLVYQSDETLNKKQWSAEDLARFRTVVIADSYEQSAEYRSTSNGSLVTITSEFVRLAFFDVKEQCVVYTTQIGTELPESKSSSHAYTVDNTEVISRVRSIMNETAVPDWVMPVLILVMGAAGITGLIKLFELISYLKLYLKRDKKK